MKIAISIPDDVFRAAEAAAQRNGMSRSELFTEAVRFFLKTCGGQGVTDRLNDVYAGRDSKLDAVLSRMQSAALREDW